MQPRTYAYLAWVVVCLVWGTTYLAIRIALETVPPFLMAGMRWAAAGSILMAGLRLAGVHPPPVRAWPSLMLLGVLMIGLGNGGVVWAEKTIPSGLTALFISAIPFWMIGIEQCLPNAASLRGDHTIGLVIGFLGIVLLVWPELDVQAGRDFLTGFAMTQLACLGWALGSNVTRQRAPGEHVLAAAAVQMLSAGVGFVLLGLAVGESSALVFNQRTAAAVVYLTVAGSIVAYSAYAYALRHLSVATVSLYAYVNPVIAVALGTLILDEPLNPRLAAAGALVLLGAALVRRR